jgi:hypothetical protein
MTRKEWMAPVIVFCGGTLLLITLAIVAPGIFKDTSPAEVANDVYVHHQRVLSTGSGGHIFVGVTKQALDEALKAARMNDKYGWADLEISDRIFFSFAINACTSFQLTCSTGSRSSPLKQLGLFPITLTHRPCVTTYFPNSKPREIVTSWRGFSSPEHWLSLGEHPIMNFPAGIETNSNSVAAEDVVLLSTGDELVGPVADPAEGEP